jgi:ferritin-like metal-binding protein YciE
MAQENNPLQELLVDELRDLYSAERQIVSALPKMAKKATHDDLRTAFERHLEETKEHVARLERIADDLDISLRGKKCKGLEGLVDEGKEVMSEFDDEALDAGLIGAAQKVEHYEIAAYGTARTHANTLGLSRVAKLLQQTLDEESKTDKKLTQLADSIVNVEALQGA